MSICVYTTITRKGYGIYTSLLVFFRVLQRHRTNKIVCMPLNNMNLNWTSLLICKFCSINIQAGLWIPGLHFPIQPTMNQKQYFWTNKVLKKKQYFWSIVGNMVMWKVDCIHCSKPFYLKDLSTHRF